MKKQRLITLFVCILLCLQLVSCKKEAELHNGYYTAEASEYNFGWKEHVTICVMNNQIVSVEYNAENASGFIKSWDLAYMRNMDMVTGTYPNKYTREYAQMLLEDQGADHIDAVSGASTSYESFMRLSAAVLEQARKGDTTVAVVDIPHEKEE